MREYKIHLFSDGCNHEEDVERFLPLIEDFFEDKECSFKFDHYDMPLWRKDKDFDFLIFDYGGMSIGNNMDYHFSRELLKYLEEHPSRYVVIESAFTSEAMSEAQRDYGDNPNVLYGLDSMFFIITELEEMRKKK